MVITRNRGNQCVGVKLLLNQQPPALKLSLLLHDNIVSCFPLVIKDHAENLRDPVVLLARIRHVGHVLSHHVASPDLRRAKRDCEGDCEGGCVHNVFRKAADVTNIRSGLFFGLSRLCSSQLVASRLAGAHLELGYSHTLLRGPESTPFPLHGLLIVVCYSV